MSSIRSDFLNRNAASLTEIAHPISSRGEYDRLIELAGDAQFALIGEASHGTHDFYSTRAELTRRLITEKDFRIIALEADWPDTLRVHRYVTGRAEEPDAAEALGEFRRFPGWMWRNTVMAEFVEWLRKWNLQKTGEEARVGIFGMDLYSMHASMESVVGYLDKVDPDAARRARARYGCFEFFGQDPQLYGYATTRGQAESCEDEVVAQLTDLRRKYGELIGRDGEIAEDEFFYAEQNARLVANAERYYRSMFRGRDESWNLRDAHMTETLGALTTRFDSGRSKIVVWAHNSHLGDARATEMSERGEWNVGQLTRERLGGRVFGIGFSTYSGTVTAARDWGGPAERRRVRPGLPGSTKSSFTRRECHGSGSIYARTMPPRNCFARGGCNGPLALFIARKPSAGVIISRPVCRTNSTPSFISMKQPPWNHSTLQGSGNAGNCPRRTRRDSESQP